MKKTLIIGIAGGSASGKSALAKRIYKAFEDDKTLRIIKLDDYYNDQSDISFNERCLTNYDHPFAFDWQLMNTQINTLIEGKEILKPTYDYANHNRSDNYETIKPADVLLIEGLFVLENKELRDKCDIKVYVDTPADIRFIRRLKRDVNERGRSLESIIGQYLDTVRLMHEQFIETSKKYADIIILEGGHNKVALDLLITKISSII
ncbi:MAG: uridine kinase [Erysipelotrichaceae bacterium]